jgi:type I restriction enzyme, R subunit
MGPEFSKKELSERDICTKFITPALTSGSKWDLMNQIREEASSAKGRVIVRGQLSTSFLENGLKTGLAKR